MAVEAVWQGNPDKAICAFTFDDGPSQLPLELWLDVLEEEDAVGTFFFTGEWMDRYPHKAREIISRGHVLAPHTYHHRRMAQVPKREFLEQLKLTELAYQDATGLPCPNFMRFPYCSYNKDESLEWLDEWGGYRDIEGIDCGDWAGRTPEEIVAVVEPKLGNGTIVVMHSNDIAVGSPEALRQLIQLAKAQGIRGAGVPEMLESMGLEVGYRPWKITVEVPAQGDMESTNWTKLSDNEQLKKLAADSIQWGLPQYSMQFSSEAEWLEHLETSIEEFGVTENRELFALREFSDSYWGYVRAGVVGDTLVLLDYAFREAQADTLVYLLRWAIERANELGLTQIEARRDIRRMKEMCRQIGLQAEIKEDQQ